MSKKKNQVTLTVKCSYWVNVTLDKEKDIAPWEKLYNAGVIDGESYLGDFLTDIVHEDDCYAWEFEIIDIDEKEIMVKEQKIDNERMSVERWKEAVKAGSNDANYRRENGYTMTKDDFFVDGVQWADEHPRKGLVDLDALWHDVSEEADLSKPVLLYDVDGGWMSPPSKFLLKDMPGFVDAMNRKYGANYTKWVYQEDILPSKKED